MSDDLPALSAVCSYFIVHGKSRPEQSIWAIKLIKLHSSRKTVSGWSLHIIVPTLMMGETKFSNLQMNWTNCLTKWFTVSKLSKHQALLLKKGC